jgi:CelD/BcsL family acetyltransferase involved in cellulose biosynthesis
VEAEVVTQVAALEPVESDWRRLAEARGNAFATPEWFRAVLEANPDEAPHAVVVRRHSELTGVLPLVSSGGTLRFAGALFADWLHPAALAAEEDAVAAAAGEALAAADGWSMLVIDNVDAQATWPRRLACGRLAAVGGGAAPAPLPYAELPADWDAYLATRSRNLRSQLGRKLRALERDHDVVMRLGDLDDLDTLFDLHGRRRDVVGGFASSLVHEDARAFHRSFATVARDRGWLRLWLLEADGAPVAAWYGWRIGHRYAYYNAGFDPAWADRSVGLVLLARTIRAAVEEGASEYDFLLGGEAYKERFATGERLATSLIVTPRFHPARALATADAALRWSARKLPERVRNPIRRAASVVVRRLPTTRGR